MGEFQGNAIRIQFPGGRTEELTNVKLLEVDGKPFNDPGDVDEAFQEISRVLASHEAVLNEHRRQLDSLTIASGERREKII